MKAFSKFLFGLLLVTSLVTTSLAQTDGAAKLEATILDYSGSTGVKHWTVVWITTGSGTFIKSLRKQGPNWTTTHWDSHCSVWNSARGGSAGSQALDGYSSATAQDYTGTNSPIILTWNCRDASNNLMPDGSYKFWIQYAEDAGQGPCTTTGLLWIKGSAGATNTYANQGANFANMKVAWRPAASSPNITSTAPTATGVVGVPYNFTCTANGSLPVTFTATGLPTGITISAAGVISGTPTTAGTFAGIITAANGNLPNSTQLFSIVINLVTPDIAAVQLNGNNLVMSGSGPANGIYTVLVSADHDASPAQWLAIATNSFDGDGRFSFTNAISSDVPQEFYRLRLP